MLYLLNTLYSRMNSGKDNTANNVHLKLFTLSNNGSLKFRIA